MSLKTFIKILLVFSALFLPFWASLAIFLFSIFYFEHFYFGLVILFCMDLLYGFQTINLFDIPGVLFFGSVVVFILSEGIKKFVIIRPA